MKRTPIKATPSQPRNAPCVCGSGKKAKHCCIAAHDRRVAARVVREREILQQRIEEARTRQREGFTNTVVTQASGLFHIPFLIGGTLPFVGRKRTRP